VTKIEGLLEIIRFLMQLLTDVEKNKSVLAILEKWVEFRNKKKLIDCGVRNGLQRIM